jgi:hypothetical protein
MTGTGGIVAGPRRAVGDRRWMLLKEAVTGHTEPVRELATGLTRDHTECAACRLRPFDCVGVGASLHPGVLARPHRVARQRIA